MCTRRLYLAAGLEVSAAHLSADGVNLLLLLLFPFLEFNCECLRMISFYFYISTSIYCVVLCFVDDRHCVRVRVGLEVVDALLLRLRLIVVDIVRGRISSTNSIVFGSITRG